MRLPVALKIALVTAGAMPVRPALVALRAIGVELTLPGARRVQPDPVRAARYDELYASYRDLYPATSALVRRLSETRG